MPDNNNNSMRLLHNTKCAALNLLATMVIEGKKPRIYGLGDIDSVYRFERKRIDRLALLWDCPVTGFLSTAAKWKPKYTTHLPTSTVKRRVTKLEKTWMFREQMIDYLVTVECDERQKDVYLNLVK